MSALRDIDPVTLARETVCAAYDRIHTLAMGIDPGRVVVRIERDEKPWDPHAAEPPRAGGLTRWEDPESTVLGHAVLCLARYAQTGAELDAPVNEYCITLVGAADEALDDVLRPDVTTDLGLVVAAALCREALANGQAVRTSWLAALAGVTVGRVQQLVSAGDMRATVKAGDNHVRADDARRWLGGRGIQVALTK